MQPGRAERGSRGDERRRRWDDHRVQRRRELIEAAVRVIQRRGPAVTMDDIAAEAGVAKPILYGVFRDKAEPYRAVGSRVAEALRLPALAVAVGGHLHPAASLRAII